MLSVSQERDRVILDLHRRCNETLLPCDVALGLAEALEGAAEGAGREEAVNPSVVRGEVWDCKVESYDGLVCLAFRSPGPGKPSRVPLTASAARKLAELVRFKEQQARHRMRLVLKGG